MAEAQVDAFVLFNEKESEVKALVQEVEKQGISTYFWRRDIGIGQPWGKIEEEHIKGARSVLIFLGHAGWGPTHLRITREAQQLKKLRQKKFVFSVLSWRCCVITNVLLQPTIDFLIPVAAVFAFLNPMVLFRPHN